MMFRVASLLILCSVIVGFSYGKVNVILMISDGFGPTSESFARLVYQHDSKLPPELALFPLDTIMVGTSRTRPAALNRKVKNPEAFIHGMPITDSAAGATAFSCAIKTYNEAVAVSVNQKPCGTILEAAKMKNITTGMVVTSRVTHATPAAFSAHVVDRGMENLIAEYQVGMHGLGRTLDLLLGGGLCEFLPDLPNLPSCRLDKLDLLKEARKNGFSLIGSRDELMQSNHTSLPLMGLFALDHMMFDIDRSTAAEPSLAEMTSKALELLSEATRDSEQGFFLMVEGSRIDMAAHSNDPAAHYRDILAYQQAAQEVIRFVYRSPFSVLISVSDHETGGLSVGRQMDPKVYPDYVWFPGPVLNATRSTEFLAVQILKFDPKNRNKTIDDFIRYDVFEKGLGMKRYTEDMVKKVKSSQKDMFGCRDLLSEYMSRYAEVGWATHGHSGVDVNLYATGYMSELLRGNHENTDIGKFVKDILDLDLDAVTEKIKNSPVRSPASPASILLNRTPNYRVIHYH